MKTAVRKSKYKICGQEFPTKKALTDHIRKIRDSYLKSGRILESEDLEFMSEVLQLHPSVEEKIGCGVRRMWVQLNPPYYTAGGFWLERWDGTKTDFSFVHCLTPKHDTADLLAAMRTAVKGQIAGFKNRFFASEKNPLCPFLLIPLTPKNSDVDHVKPLTFNKLANDWIKATGVNPGTVKIRGYGDGEISKDLADDGLRESWRTYHMEKADLRVISHLANLSHAKKEIQLEN